MYSTNTPVLVRQSVYVILSSLLILEDDTGVRYRDNLC
jgi:hypothetical protein